MVVHTRHSFWMLLYATVLQKSMKDTDITNIDKIDVNSKMSGHIVQLYVQKALVGALITQTLISKTFD